MLIIWAGVAAACKYCLLTSLHSGTPIGTIVQCMYICNWLLG